MLWQILVKILHFLHPWSTSCIFSTMWSPFFHVLMLLGFLLTLQQGELWQDLAWHMTKMLGIPWSVDYSAGIPQIVLSFGRRHMLLSMAFHFVVEACKQYQLSLAHPVWTQKFGLSVINLKPQDRRTFALIPAIVKEKNSCRSIWRRLEWTRRWLKTLICAMTPETGALDSRQRLLGISRNRVPGAVTFQNLELNVSRCGKIWRQRWPRCHNLNNTQKTWCQNSGSWANWQDCSDSGSFVNVF